jgi:hypothetical protein
MLIHSLKRRQLLLDTRVVANKTSPSASPVYDILWGVSENAISISSLKFVNTRRHFISETERKNVRCTKLLTL